MRERGEGEGGGMEKEKGLKVREWELEGKKRENGMKREGIERAKGG